MPRSKPFSRLDCRQAAQQTTDFLEGRLPATVRGRFVRHLEVCSACSTYVRQMALVSGAVRELPALKMPAGNRRKLLERLKARRASG